MEGYGMLGLASDIGNSTNDDKIYVLFFDNFGYLSASREDVIFYDYVFDFEDDWEDYYLDSLEPDELDSLPYTEGFGTRRVADGRALSSRECPGQGLGGFHRLLARGGGERAT